ncbi:MAG: hypothetical protein ACOY3E_16930 [Pseudomonadota bacterium]
MNELNLNSPLGFFREIAHKNVTDFYRIHQSTASIDKAQAVQVYRYLVNACLTINHVTDKVADELSYQKGSLLIPHIKTIYPDEGQALDIVRLYSNELKHNARDSHQLCLRDKGQSDHWDAPPQLLAWSFTNRQGLTFEIVENLMSTWVFWGKYFSGERSLLVMKV